MYDGIRQFYPDDLVHFEERLQARIVGGEAFHKGEATALNPYLVTDKRYAHWLDGWVTQSIREVK